MDSCSETKISRNQAKIIALCIIADIESFCEEHSEEFQKFLKSEELNKKKGGEKK